MQITPIIIVAILWSCSFLGSININKFFQKKDKNEKIETNDILKPIIFFALALSIVIYMFTFDFLYGMLAILICAISSYIFFGFQNKEYITAIFSALLGIIPTFMLLFYPSIVAEKSDISKETILLNEYTKSSEKVIIIELGNDPKSYAIMEYDSNIDLPFTLSDIESYEIFKNKSKKDKIVVIHEDVREDSPSSYFNLLKPKINHYTSYKVYINKENVKYN